MGGQCQLHDLCWWSALGKDLAIFYEVLELSTGELLRIFFADLVAKTKTTISQTVN